ncbi:dimethylarginine dimethylaminohydrolase [Trichosporon asahii var. asahii CBS 8904]|uniref:Dimethylarginine dimethylaminohydrolase n=1 Tax=Trichosporon asahii var. asahii (strain CBS 8904) TaxID=1220162 RepID=K1VNH1_TRIAC|nr:dimethylarginine dimethylaminohydrolase [Trichosporon asahii var. asahii CBS 8904]
MPVLLVRPPASSLAQGQITHIAAPSDVSFPKAQEQWANYVKIFAEREWALIPVPRDDSCPDSVFIEDSIVVFGDMAVIASPGAETRKAEIGPVETTVKERLPGLKLHRIELPGTLDGGDVLKVGKTVYVGRSSRTSQSWYLRVRTDDHHEEDWKSIAIAENVSSVGKWSVG